MIRKIRFLEPGNLPYRVSLKNLYTYDKYIRTPGTGLMTLATIARSLVADTLMYSESISKIKWADVLDADIVLIGVFTFNANRGYELARYVRQNSHALVVLGGLHASMNYPEAVKHCDYVLLGGGDESILELIRAANDGKPMDFPGLAYFKDGKAVCTGKREPPENIDTVPDRNILYRYHKMAWHLTIWHLAAGARFPRMSAQLQLLCARVPFRQARVYAVAAKRDRGYQTGDRFPCPQRAAVDPACIVDQGRQFFRGTGLGDFRA